MTRGILLKGGVVFHLLALVFIMFKNMYNKLSKANLFLRILYRLKFIFILPLLDVISTYICVRKDGVAAELNPIGVFLISNCGIIAYPIMFILATGYAIFLLSLVFAVGKFTFKKMKRKTVLLTLNEYLCHLTGMWAGGYIFMYTLVILNNFGIINLMGAIR